jgi:NtrC-family two-component system sensor histidine kinase KinB
MKLTLRAHILLTVLPLLLLMAVLGGAAVALLYRLGGSIGTILRENYDSVLYMERLNEALERIDSSFGFALAGHEQKAREQYAQNWKDFDDNLHREQDNITLPGERESVEKLTKLRDRYRQQGDAFYRLGPGDPRRNADYFQDDGLLDRFKEIKGVSGHIRRLNQENMEEASQRARHTAQDSLIGFGIGLTAAVVLGVWLAWLTFRAVLRTVRLVTQSALAIGSGNLDQVVPVLSRDELGQLAEAFNVMARQLRHYRQTDYSRLLRLQRTGQATIDSFPDPVLVVDAEGHVELANPAAQRFLGVTGTRDGQRSAAPWQPPEPLREPLRLALQQQRPFLPEEFDRAVTFRVDGRDRSFLPRLLPIRDPYGQSLGAAVLLEDVTRFRLLDQVKSNLVATASHELKTPLTAVRLAVHLLLEETVGPLTPKQTELLVDARDNAERLLAMVNNLLDLAHLEQGEEHLDLRPEAPADLLRTAADTVRPRAEDKQVAVVVEAADDLPRVAANAFRLGHALDNLLDNALTYTNRGGRITLSATAAGDHVTLAVADTGIGIPPEYLARVFERFFRIPGQSLGTGTGLGLAIVREVVLAHGGTVTCASQPGSGTVFRLTLPVWKDEGGRESRA